VKAIVVIPTYNERGNIEKIIAAVLKSAPEVHVLIVDDNSPDGTSGLVEAMMKSDERIRLLTRAGKMGSH
jgi:dolichol-phosphate mannosyltransferase